MSLKKALNKFSTYFDMNRKKRKKHVRDLKVLLKQLKNEEKKLIASCQKISDNGKKKNMQRKIAVLSAKRKKGLKVIKKLMRE